MCTEAITVHYTYIFKDDMVLGQMNKGTGGTCLVFAPRDNDLALDVLKPTVSHDGHVLQAGGLCKPDIVRVEVVYLQAAEPSQATVERGRNEARSGDKAVPLVFRLTEETLKRKGRRCPAPFFPVYHAPERHGLRRSKDVFDQYDNRRPNGLAREFVVRDRIDDHDLRRVGSEEGHHALQVCGPRSVV